jgi:hypothetical protein
MWATKHPCRWDRFGFDKKRIGTHYDEHVFLHPVGSACHIVHFDTSGAQNVDAVFFLLRWARCGFHKMRTRTHYVELVFFLQVGATGYVMHSGASGV